MSPPISHCCKFEGHICVGTRIHIIMSDVMDTVVCIQSNEMNNISSPTTWPNLSASILLRMQVCCGKENQESKGLQYYHFRPIPSGKHGLDWFQRTIHRAHKSHYSLESSSMLALNRLNSLHVQTGAARIYDTLASRPASGWYSSEAGFSLCLNRSCSTNFSSRFCSRHLVSSTDLAHLQQG
jgi:hypothetical protein